MSVHNTTPFGCFLSFVILGIICSVLSSLDWVKVGIIAGTLVVFAALGLWYRIAIENAQIETLKKQSGAFKNLETSRRESRSPPVECPQTITKTLVAEVLNDIAAGKKVKEIAVGKKVSTSTVYKIKRGGYDIATLPE